MNILRKHGVATMRMLEQKISDAGPNPQRIDPHILTKSRVELFEKQILQTTKVGNTQWHRLAESEMYLLKRDSKSYKNFIHSLNGESLRTGWVIPPKSRS
ncbi:hypothetical protein DYQ86_14100 [Acidobacteria bacterium AB60]|nr:hypothetical protein DYQ86_14100 [Acidobacteria bacterium AB60]